MKKNYVKKEVEKFLGKGEYSLHGKKVAVSGATGGLGKALCRCLCTLGADLILLDRSAQRSCALIDELKRDFPSLSAEHITLDLESMERTRAVCCELRARRIDFLVLNAGAYSIPRHKCDSGFDNVFQINFLSPYLLMQDLLPAVAEQGGKVVIVGSIAHRYSETDMSDVDFSKRKRASLVYGNAKRHLMFASDADDYRKNIVITHPGIAVTNITAHYPKLVYALIKYPMKVIFMSPKKACISILCGLFCQGKGGEWIGPRFFDVWGRPARRSLNIPCEEQKRVYENAKSMI